MRACLVLLFCLWSSSGSSQSDMTSGNWILTACKGFATGGFVGPGEGNMTDAAFKQGTCNGVIRVLLRRGEDLPEGRRNCAPNNVSHGQAARIMVTFMEAYPQLLHIDFVDLAIEALARAFPCKK
jgi:hypothetical protein